MFIHHLLIKSQNLIILYAENNGGATLKEKTLSDHHNDEDNVNVSTKDLVLRKIIQKRIIVTVTQ